MNIASLSAARRLAHCRPFRTDDLDAARAHISALFKPHELTVVGRRQKLDVCIGGGGIDAISLLYHRHGAHVRVKPGRLERFYLLQIPLRGRAHGRVGNHDVLCGPGQGMMISPCLDVEMEFAQGCEQLILRIDADCLERHISRQVEPASRPTLVFAPQVDLSGRTGNRILALLDYLAAVIHSHPEEDDCPGSTRAAIASLVLNTLVDSLDHNRRDAMQDADETPKPRHLKRAMQYMVDHLCSPVSPEDVAHAINISPRSLYGSFQQYLDTTPMRHLKDLRLDKARERLLAADPENDSVTAVALEFCFQHFGHFSAAYKARFGELPSDTLSKRRRFDHGHGIILPDVSSRAGSRQ